METETPKPVGRPTALTQVLRRNDRGEPVTVGDQIVMSIRAGNYFEQACEAAGIGKRTGYRWLREGALCSRKLERDPKAKTTANERHCMEFWHSVTAAEAAWEVTAVTTLEQLARGGLRTTTETVKKDRDGNITEHITRTEALPPNPSVLMWRLERRFPDRYGRKVEVTSTIEDPLTRDDRAEDLAAKVEAYLQGREDQASDTAEDNQPG